MSFSPFSNIFILACLFAGTAAQAQDPISDRVDADELEVATATDDSPSGFIALGAAVTTNYEGSDQYQLNPLVFASVEWQGMELQIAGLTATLDLLADSRFDIGPAINRRQNRDPENIDGRVADLAAIDNALEAGAFVGYSFGGNEYGEGEISLELSAFKDVSDTHDGFTASAQVSYAAVRTQSFMLDVDVQANYGDASFNQTYFGVTPAEAQLSGLTAFDPGSGLRDVSVGATAAYMLTRRWGVLARAGVSTYIGDIANSPVVEEGSDIQLGAGIGVFLRF